MTENNWISFRNEIFNMQTNALMVLLAQVEFSTKNTDNGRRFQFGKFFCPTGRKVWAYLDFRLPIQTLLLTLECQCQNCKCRYIDRNMSQPPIPRANSSSNKNIESIE